MGGPDPGMRGDNRDAVRRADAATRAARRIRVWTNLRPLDELVGRALRPGAVDDGIRDLGRAIMNQKKVDGLRWQAVRYVGTGFAGGCPNWLVDAAKEGSVWRAGGRVRVMTRYGHRLASRGDWILRDAAGGLEVQTAEQMREEWEMRSGGWHRRQT